MKHLSKHLRKLSIIEEQKEQASTESDLHQLGISGTIKQRKSGREVYFGKSLPKVSRLQESVTISQDFNIRVSEDEPNVVTVPDNEIINVGPRMTHDERFVKTAGPRLTQDQIEIFGKSASEAVNLKDMMMYSPKINSPKVEDDDDESRI